MKSSAAQKETEARSRPVAGPDRVMRTLWKLARRGVRGWAITGGVALEIHRARLRGESAGRPLNDLDFIAGSFGAIPGTLADGFLFRHIHPSDPPGRMMLQFVDPEGALRVDLFRADGGTMTRTLRADFLPEGIGVISLEDLTARAARLVLPIGEGLPVLSKQAGDFLDLAGLADPAQVEKVWPDHRKPDQPASFREAACLLRRLIPERQNLLVTEEHSKDTGEICPRCAPTRAFHLANPEVIRALLGYC